MSKSTKTVLGLVVAILLITGGYLLFFHEASSEPIILKERDPVRVQDSSIVHRPGSEKDSLKEDKLAALTQEAMLAFKQSIESGGMAPFYNYISPSWQASTSPEELQKQFAAFFDSDLDLTPVVEGTPVIPDNPTLDGTSLIHQGYYQLDGQTLHFQIMHLYVDGNWELAGLRLRVE